MLNPKPAIFALGMMTVALGTPASAQDAEPLQMQSGTITAGGESASTIVDATGDRLLAIDVMPVGTEWDPMIVVTDATTGALIGEDDDGGNGLASRLIVPRDFSGYLNVEVRNLSAQGEATPVRYMLMVSEATLPQIDTVALNEGDTINATLASGAADFYEFSAQAGQSLELAVSAADGGWDTMAQIFTRESAGTGEPITANDDKGGGSLDSFISFIAPAAGAYVLRVSAIGEEAGGYSVSLARGPDVSGPEAYRPIGFGETRRLVIHTAPDSTGEVTDEGQLIALSDAARRQLASGRGRVVISLAGTRAETDPVVTAGFLTPLGFASVAEDDDGAGELNSRLTLDLGQLGEAAWRDAFRIAVRAINGGVNEVELRVDLRE